MQDINNPNWEDEYEEYTDDEDDDTNEEDGIDWEAVEKITPYNKENK